LLISLTARCATFALNGVNTFLPSYLHDARGFAVDDAGALTGALYAVGVIGLLMGGFVGDRLAGRIVGARPMLVAAALVPVVPAAFGITRAESIEVALVSYGVTQLARGFAEPNIYSTVIDTIVPRERGTALGFLLMVNFVGGTLAPFVIGRLIASNGGFSLAFDVLGVAAVVASTLAAALVMHTRAARR
jgi:sugar phosphate permease